MRRPFHAVEIDPAVEVVALVLDHAREEALRLHRDRACRGRSRASRRTRLQRGTTPRRSGMERQPSQARSFSSPSGVTRRVDEHGQGDGVARPLVRGRDLDDGEAQPDVHLGPGQAHAVVLVHGVDHVVHEPLQVR